MIFSANMSAEPAVESPRGLDSYKIYQINGIIFSWFVVATRPCGLSENSI
jgi:hypothetical protein